MKYGEEPFISKIHQCASAARRRVISIPVLVFAKPPSAVSFKETGIIRPISSNASMTSSGGITLFTPAKAISAAVMAMTEKIPLRFTQGTSTKPATGSQASPRIFFIARANACNTSSFVPPANSVTAAAAIAAAEPHSAWQPPTAPATEAFLATTAPTAAAV